MHAAHTAAASRALDRDGGAGRGCAGRGAATARGSRVTSDGIVFSRAVRSLADLRDDDEAAAAEAAAQGGACAGPQPARGAPRAWRAGRHARACTDAFEDSLER